MTQYRQIAHKLRVQMGRGHPDWESERPRNKKTNRYKDLDEQGRSATIVEIPPGAHIDQLLRAGAIQTIETEDASGEGCEPPNQDLA
jgi:hypothetical protein